MNIKKLLVYIVILSLILGMTGCNNTTKEDSSTEDNIAVQPFSNDINTDILTRHLFPTFERMEESDRREFVESLQVYRKISELKLDREDFLYPEKNLERLKDSLDSIRKSIPAHLPTADFSGRTSEELSSFIVAHAGSVINIISEKIAVSEQIQIPSDTYIAGNGVELEADGCAYVLLVNNAENVVLESISIRGEADYGVFIANSKNITVDSCKITGLNQKGICITAGSSLFCIQNNEISQNGAGGIYCAGDISKGIIEGNKIHNNFGTSNWMAGVVLSNAITKDPLDIWENFDENHRCPARDNLYLQTDCPHEIILENNEVSSNNSSGIYSDGAYNCHLLFNDVYSNDKEGICLDNGTIGTYLKDNTIINNGGRYKQTDDDLRMDYVFEAGRLNDGSAKAKLPGISLDNTAYNIIENNVVANNYGGGIKMVRSTIRCLINENVIKDNNRGQNDTFHFFGIELGAAIPDELVADMDFTSDFENIVCRNIISGDHYSGIFLGTDCYVNDIFDNVIMEPQMFAIECISVKFNSMLNNFSNAPVRNEYKEDAEGKS